MITRYFFSQFWCEFTKDVLGEFIQEDLSLKMTEIHQVKSPTQPKSSKYTNPKRKHAKPPLNANLDGIFRLTNEGHQIIKQITSNTVRPTLNANDQSDKRAFYLRLFKIYHELGFDECLKNYTRIFNDVFTREKPILFQKYFLTEIQVAECFEDS